MRDNLMMFYTLVVSKHAYLKPNKNIGPMGPLGPGLIGPINIRSFDGFEWFQIVLGCFLPLVHNLQWCFIFKIVLLLKRKASFASTNIKSLDSPVLIRLFFGTFIFFLFLVISLSLIETWPLKRFIPDLIFFLKYQMHLHDLTSIKKQERSKDLNMEQDLKKISYFFLQSFKYLLLFSNYI